ncbi:MAG: BREX system ATP-binding domain-containing protein [Actinomycetota bacterium]
MTSTLHVDAYLEFLNKEYLGDFIRGGGSSVKFIATVDDATKHRFARGLNAAAARNGFQLVQFDSVSTRAHQMDQLFFALSRQLDWQSLATHFVRSAYDLVSFPVPDEPGALRVAAASQRHGVDQRELYRSVRRSLEAQILHDRRMEQHFRLAMFRLCQSQLEAGDVDEGEVQAILEWLRGELRQISRLRGSFIYSRIARHNARQMLYSTSHWLSRTNCPGMVLSADLSRLFATKRPTVEERLGFYYSKAMVLDAYEVLRQLLDATDDLESTLVIVRVPIDFLVDEARGLSAYSALQLRLADEVRDRQRPNPFAGLVRLEECP